VTQRLFKGGELFRIPVEKVGNGETDGPAVKPPIAMPATPVRVVRWRKSRPHDREALAIALLVRPPAVVPPGKVSSASRKTKLLAKLKTTKSRALSCTASESCSPTLKVVGNICSFAYSAPAPTRVR